MVDRDVIFRLVGNGAICLAALLAPLQPTELVAVLTTYSLGLVTASVLPSWGREAARVVGPANSTPSGATTRLQAGYPIRCCRDVRPGAMCHSGIQNQRTSAATESGAASRSNVGNRAGYRTPRRETCRESPSRAGPPTPTIVPYE